MLSLATASTLRRTPLFALKASRGPVGTQAVATHRGLSFVTTLSDLDAVEKFTQLNSKCVLYYTATWCGPCKAIKPVYEQFAKYYGDKIALGKVDVDDNAEAAAVAAVSAVPTFVAFHNNESVAQFAGADQTKLGQMLTALSEKK